MADVLDEGLKREADKRLRDIVALSTLPALWAGSEPRRIAESLAASLFTMLDPDFVVIYLNGGPGFTVSIAQIDRHRTSETLAAKLEQPLREWAVSHDPDEFICQEHPLTGKEVYITTRPLGYEVAHGVIAVGFPSRDDLTPLSHLLLNVAATQAAMAVRGAKLLQEVQEREEQFRTLANAIPQLAWMAKADGHIFWYNQGWYSYCGMSPEQMEGWGWQSIHDPKMLPAVLERWKRSLTTGDPFEMEFPLRAANGEFRMFLTRVNPIRNSSGDIVRWFGTNTDVEDLKRAREALSESVATLATLNRLGQSISGELDLEKVVQTVTDTATQLSGAKFGALFYNVTNDKGESYTLYTLSGASRKAFEQFPMPRNTAVFKPTFEGTGVVRSDDITKDARYGKNAPHSGMPQGHLPVRSYLAVPVVSRSHQVLGGLFFGHPEAGVFKDREEDLVRGIAAQAAIAIDNAHLFQKSLDAIHARELFLSIASHELKTPLTSLKLQAQIRKRAVDRGEFERFAPEKLPKLLAEDEKQINRILKLVEDMLDISRIQAGKLSLNLESFDLSAQVRELLDRFSAMIQSAGCTVSFVGDPVVGTWDRFRMEQIITNLLTNAIKYGAGSPIVIELRAEPHVAVLSIRDHGIGIAPEDHARIFGQFERVASSNGAAGFGLGLYIVKQLVDSHGGRIAVSSELKKGATFSLELPLGPVSASAGNLK